MYKLVVASAETQERWHGKLTFATAAARTQFPWFACQRVFVQGLGKLLVPAHTKIQNKYLLF